jgi:exosortase B
MSEPTATATASAPEPAPRGWLGGGDPWVLGLVLLGLVGLYGPTYYDFLHGFWVSYHQGHEPLVMAVSAWLIWRKREALAQLPDARAPWSTAFLLVFGLLLYAFGRTQQFLRLELLSQLFVLAGVLVCFKGWAGVRTVWFALLFLLFVVPLPYSAVIAITGPLKTGVSMVATWLMSGLGYPIGRSGVVITIGQYQLLVAEACAGLQTMFTLEALGLLYTNLMAYRSPVRSVLMGLLVVPVAFLANVVRVVILVLITYYLGDEVGQGFVHGFAGMVLFAVALFFIMSLDRVLGWVLPKKWAE